MACENVRELYTAQRLNQQLGSPLPYRSQRLCWLRRVVLSVPDDEDGNGPSLGEQLTVRPKLRGDNDENCH